MDGAWHPGVRLVPLGPAYVSETCKGIFQEGSGGIAGAAVGAAADVVCCCVLLPLLPLLLHSGAR